MTGACINSLLWEGQGKIYDQMVEDVLFGIAYLHGKGYFHLDLKPQSIFFRRVSDQGLKTFISDFTVAVSAHELQKGGIHPGQISTVISIDPDMSKNCHSIIHSFVNPLSVSKLKLLELPDFIFSQSLYSLQENRADKVDVYTAGLSLAQLKAETTVSARWLFQAGACLASLCSPQKFNRNPQEECFDLLIDQRIVQSFQFLPVVTRKAFLDQIIEAMVNVHTDLGSQFGLSQDQMHDYVKNLDDYYQTGKATLFEINKELLIWSMSHPVSRYRLPSSVIKQCWEKLKISASALPSAMLEMLFPIY